MTIFHTSEIATQLLEFQNREVREAIALARNKAQRAIASTQSHLTRN
ncbi:MAG: hypothetical protein HC856_10795 [Pseudanabaena sp. RU_4_16]|nr:hypothetical protein [Pseudanabaena sp. RU_4_16]